MSNTTNNDDLINADIVQIEEGRVGQVEQNENDDFNNDDDEDREQSETNSQK